MLDFLLFKRMLTPIIIQLLFWAGTLLCVIGGIWNFSHHAIAHGLQVLIIGPLLLRVICEFLVVFFNINQRLTDLKNTVQE